jgi:hypothetical protein
MTRIEKIKTILLAIITVELLLITGVVIGSMIYLGGF